VNFLQARHHVESRLGGSHIYAEGGLSTVEVNRCVERARQALVDKLLQQGDVSPLLRSTTANTVTDQTDYTLDAVLRVVDLSLKYTAAGSYRKAREIIQGWDVAISGENPWTQGAQTAPVYRRKGKTTFEIYPAPTSSVADGIQLDYVPDFATWTSDTDDLGLPEFYCVQMLDVAAQLVAQRLGIAMPEDKQ
jgi:hypothetical protein